ncbi:hypothetical protein [Methanobrevibacter curvatus]|uniref:Uncharacterized protein n=1 Tax=Methanobrevibacter curvatus TaxID=49547 RepID=A0A162FIP9_9EURY|nr:hypothetical protein [Methanobrevibacter curvatus]KZX10580.1 hypothetical protein MBCUR_17370 [Methanobrevibacter curvatus]
MVFEIKHGLIKRDSLDESFELYDKNGYFEDDEVLVAIDTDTLISIQILIHTISENKFKKWNKIKKTKEIEDISSLFLKLGYKREDVIKFLKQLE